MIYVIFNLLNNLKFLKYAFDVIHATFFNCMSCLNFIMICLNSDNLYIQEIIVFLKSISITCRSQACMHSTLHPTSTHNMLIEIAIQQNGMRTHTYHSLASAFAIITIMRVEPSQPPPRHYILTLRVHAHMLAVSHYCATLSQCPGSPRAADIMRCYSYSVTEPLVFVPRVGRSSRQNTEPQCKWNERTRGRIICRCDMPCVIFHCMRIRGSVRVWIACDVLHWTRLRYELAISLVGSDLKRRDWSWIIDDFIICLTIRCNIIRCSCPWGFITQFARFE